MQPSDVTRVVHMRGPTPSSLYPLQYVDLLLSTVGMNKSDFELLFREEVGLRGGVCMEAASATTYWGDMLQPGQQAKLRSAAHKFIGVETKPAPEQRVGWLIRNEGNQMRRALGKERAFGRVPGGVEVFTVNSSMSLAEQGRAFARYGVIIFSHSSQFINSYMAQPNTTFLELHPLATPYSLEFHHLAMKLGLRHSYVLWQWPCYKVYRMSSNATCSRTRTCASSFPTIQLDYAVNMTALVPALDDALRYIGLEPIEEPYAALDNEVAFFQLCFGAGKTPPWLLPKYINATAKP
jgi:hypothetical protein